MAFLPPPVAPAMRRGAILAALLTALLLAGCVSDGGGSGSATGTTTDATTTYRSTGHGDPIPPPPPPKGDTMTIRGVVLDGSLQPLAATVLLQELNRTQRTTAAGTFEFTGLVPHAYFLTASAPEYKAQTLSTDAERAKETLKFVLEPLPRDVATNVTVRFHGHLQCALEVLIISPACDSVLTDPRVGGPAVFNSTSTTLLPVEANWRTVVADVVFDPSGQPLLDGLRVTVKGTYNQTGFGTYEQYGRFNNTSSFTFRVEPGQEYADGTSAVPSNMTQFKFEVYPQSKLWHTVCVPPGEGGTCFLGAGAGLDVDFDLYLTTFYAKPAPAGWSFQASSG